MSIFQENWLTTISGILTIATFLLQLSPYFPDRKDTFKNITFVTLGIFIGSIINIANSTTVQLESDLSLLGIIVTLVQISAIILAGYFAITSNNSNDNGDKAFASTFLFLLLFTYHAFTYDEETKSKLDLNSYELTMLVNNAVSEKQFEKAIHYLETIRSNTNNIEVIRSLNKKIKELEINSIETLDTAF
jgi:hypothetical protein